MKPSYVFICTRLTTAGNVQAWCKHARQNAADLLKIDISARYELEKRKEKWAAADAEKAI